MIPWVLDFNCELKIFPRISPHCCWVMLCCVCDKMMAIAKGSWSSEEKSLWKKNQKEILLLENMLINKWDLKALINSQLYYMIIYCWTKNIFLNKVPRSTLLSLISPSFKMVILDQITAQPHPFQCLNSFTLVKMTQPQKENLEINQIDWACLSLNTSQLLNSEYQLRVISKDTSR